MLRSCSKISCRLAALALLTLATNALAGQDDVRLLPTLVPEPAPPGAPVTLARPPTGDERPLARWARHLDGILIEAVQDLGLKLDVSERPSEQGQPRDDELVERAAESWVISPRLSVEDGKLRFRIVAVAPGSRVLLMRTQELEAREVEVRAMVMLRDVVQAGRREPSERAQPTKPPVPDEQAVVYHARSRGRAVLALNAAALGGYIGFTIQRASTASNEDPDPRLTYPLIALGAGIGLGGSMIVADEWDVGLGDAWYLSAGAWWPGAAGFLLAHGYHAPENQRHSYAVAGAAGGVTLATVALTFGGMGEGGALLAHSGGAFGMLLGGVTELAIDPDTDETPTLGMGYGTGIGVLAAGALATQVHASPSRILLIDLGASLGALTGAAAASPLLLVGDEPTEGRDRAWLASIAAGTLIGGAIGWWATRPSSSASMSQPWAVLPWAGIVAETEGPNAERTLAPGGGVRGVW